MQLLTCRGQLLFCVLIASAVWVPPAAAQENILDNEPDTSTYAQMYLHNCAVCHGESLQGAAQGTPLYDVELKHGDSIADISNSIANGFPAAGMPAWANTLSAKDITNIALYITETRANWNYGDFKYDAAFVLPTDPITSELHTFTLATVIADIDPLPFSIAPLPDGSLLLIEKKLGMSIISPDGHQSAYITGTPPTYADTYTLTVKQEWGNGWMMDVALHPNYAQNGWIYLQYGARCENCNAISREAKRPVSMNKLIRGRIVEGQWVDQEVIWESDLKYYGPMPDLAGGGRIAFDNSGHVFISVGMKGIDNHTGIQDLSVPWGKIHRVHDDGHIPLDNPFVSTEGALKSIWTFGHRSPQGLEFRPNTGDLWGTEMGPRGGDEVNRLLPGKNYGWPLYSKGMNYDGSPVAYGKSLGIEFDLSDIQQPVVDLTPSPAVSSFVFYAGDMFPAWQGDMIVGSLKAQTLYRIRLDGNTLGHKETLISNLARIRDIETGHNGEIYLLLENNAGGQIVVMRAADRKSVNNIARKHLTTQ